MSAAEHFIAADEDGSGALDVEELAQATGTSLRKPLNSTLKRIPTATAWSRSPNLSHPWPQRRPLPFLETGCTGAPPLAGQKQQPAQPAQAPPQRRPQPLPQQPWQQQPQQQGWPQQTRQQPQQQGWPQQQPRQQPQQGWPQPQASLVQPTIRSGVHCRGCGIGLDPYWRFCPVCGQQNLGY